MLKVQAQSGFAYPRKKEALEPSYDVEKTTKKLIKALGWKFAKLKNPPKVLDPEVEARYVAYRRVLYAYPDLLATTLDKLSDEEKEHFLIFLNSETDLYFKWKAYSTYTSFDWNILIAGNLYAYDKALALKAAASDSRYLHYLLEGDIGIQENNDLYLKLLLVDNPINNKSLLQKLEIPENMIDSAMSIFPSLYTLLTDSQKTYERSLVYLQSDGNGLRNIPYPQTLEQIKSAIDNRAKAIVFANTTSDVYNEAVRYAMTKTLQFSIDFTKVSEEVKKEYYQACVENEYIPVEYLDHIPIPQEVILSYIERTSWIHQWYLFFLLDYENMVKALSLPMKYKFSTSTPKDAVFSVPKLVAEHTEEQLLLYRNLVLSSNEVVPFLESCRRELKDSNPEAYERVLGVYKDALNPDLLHSRNKDLALDIKRVQRKANKSPIDDQVAISSVMSRDEALRLLKNN